MYLVLGIIALLLIITTVFYYNKRNKIIKELHKIEENDIYTKSKKRK